MNAVSLLRQHGTDSYFRLLIFFLSIINFFFLHHFPHNKGAAIQDDLHVCFILAFCFERLLQSMVVVCLI